MKKLLPLLFCAQLAVAPEVYAQWHSVSSGTSEAMYGGAFADSATVYLSGWGSDGASVFKSTDRGETWSASWHDDGQFFIFGVTFPDPQSGFVAGYDPGCNCALILQTNDSGNSWNGVTFSSLFGFYKLVKPDASTMLACGYNGAIIRTTNSGKNWAATQTGNDTLVYRIMNFGDANTGYAVGGATFQLMDKFYKTTDGGATWSVQKDYNGARSVGDLFFFDAMTGLYAGSDGTDCVYKTTNGGTSWMRVYSGNDKSVFTGIAFANKMKGFAVNEAGRLIKTTDGGDHWTSDYDNTAISLNVVVANANGRAVAAALDGSVYTNGAASSVRMMNSQPTNIAIDGNKILHVTSDITSLRIFDLLGREVLRSELNNSDEYSLASLASGTYIWSGYRYNTEVSHGKVLLE